MKLYLYLGTAAAFIGLSLYTWGLSNSLELAKERRDAAIASNAAFEKALSDERAILIQLEELNFNNLSRLRDAKIQIDSMRAAVESGAGELRVNAECPEHGGMPKATATVSKPDAVAPRLSNAAERNYFLLRERHEEAINQILGLQDYIRTACQ